MSENDFASVSLDDLKLLVRQLRAIDAKDVTLKLKGSKLIASASGMDSETAKFPCDQHCVFVPKCAAKGTYKDGRGNDRPGCRAQTYTWQAQMSSVIGVDGDTKPMQRTTTVKALAQICKLKTPRVKLSVMGFTC